MVSICTGAFVLGAAGCSTASAPPRTGCSSTTCDPGSRRAQVVDEGIFVKDGRVWTSAGITAGIDLALALVEEDHGHQVAMAVARRLVLFLRRSGNQAQFSSALQRQESEPPTLRDISAFVLEHVDQPLPVARLARAAA